MESYMRDMRDIYWSFKEICKFETCSYHLLQVKITQFKDAVLPEYFIKITERLK
jgi:hypothetical protein